LSVVIATELVRTTYGELVKSSLALPYDPKQKPSEQALAAHLEWSGIQVEVAARPANGGLLIGSSQR
jgi:hypothetical protein